MSTKKNNKTKNTTHTKKSFGYAPKRIPSGVTIMTVAPDGTVLYTATPLVMLQYFPDLYALKPGKAGYVLTGTNGVYTPLGLSNHQYDNIIAAHPVRTQSRKAESTTAKKPAAELTTYGDGTAYSAYDVNHPATQSAINRYTYSDDVNELRRDKELSAKMSSYGAGNFLNTIIPMHLIAPTNYIGAMGEAARGNDNFFLNALSGNNKGIGSLSDDLSKWADEHPYWNMAANFAGDAFGFGMLGDTFKLANSANKLYNLNKPLITSYIKYPTWKTHYHGRSTSFNIPEAHVQGDEAIKMFKEYGGEPIPEGSINGQLLRLYVSEARERYGIVGDTRITDEEIAQSLYKHVKELGRNTAAVNKQGEPLLLFRGDTKRYTTLKERISPEELAEKSGTMDNSLGTLFLGEFPNNFQGVDRYIGTWRNFNGNKKLIGSGTGSKVTWDGKTASEIEGTPLIGPKFGGGYKLYSTPTRHGLIDVYKLPSQLMESKVNDLNAFVVRTSNMRDASSEISVLNDDWMLQGAKGSHFMSKDYQFNPETLSMQNIKTGKFSTEATEARKAMGSHYGELIKEAEQKSQGLLKSEANSPLRDEHSKYTYFALPNFNIKGAKHILPYDLRIPRNWEDKNIYRALVPVTTVGSIAAGSMVDN